MIKIATAPGRTVLASLSAAALAACATPLGAGGPQAVSDLAPTPPPRADTPITQAPWREVVISVRDLDETARFFLEVGRYETRARGAVDEAELAYWGLPTGATGEALVLAAPGSTHGLVRLVRFDNAGARAPMRPGGQAWDTGCIFSIMIRMKDMDAIYDEALSLGWWTHTPITDLEFGTSKLKVVIYKGPDGVQVQGYERLTPPLPDTIPEFERFTQPFNIMQMVSDRETNARFYRGVLGFDNFYYGKPFTAPEPTPTPIGIPLSLTTSVAYQAGIYYPVPGEFGRLENIDIVGVDGFDFSDRCHAPNYGVLAVRYPVEDAAAARALVLARGGSVERETADAVTATMGPVRMFGVDTPDGAMIDFFEEKS